MARKGGIKRPQHAYGALRRLKLNITGKKDDKTRPDQAIYKLDKKLQQENEQAKKDAKARAKDEEVVRQAEAAAKEAQQIENASLAARFMSFAPGKRK